MFCQKKKVSISDKLLANPSEQIRNLKLTKETKVSLRSAHKVVTKINIFSHKIEVVHETCIGR